MGREFNKSTVESVMREVRVDNAIDKIKSEVIASKMDTSKKANFVALAKMMSESELGRVRIMSDSLAVQERVGITELSETPKIGLIKRARDPETQEYNEGLFHMTPEEVVDYAVPRMDKEKLDDVKKEVFYDAVRREINGQIARSGLTDNDKLHLEGITAIVTTSVFRRMFLNNDLGKSIETVGIANVQNPETGKEEHRLAVFKKQKDPKTGKITEEVIEKSLEYILSYALPRMARETVEKGRKMALTERARTRITADIDKTSLPEEKKTELKAVLHMVLTTSLNRVNIKSSNLGVVERVGVTFGRNPRLAIIKRSHDPETGMGNEHVIEMSPEEISDYIQSRIPSNSREEVR